MYGAYCAWLLNNDVSGCVSCCQNETVLSCCIVRRGLKEFPTRSVPIQKIVEAWAKFIKETKLMKNGWRGLAPSRWLIAARPSHSFAQECGLTSRDPYDPGGYTYEVRGKWTRRSLDTRRDECVPMGVVVTHMGYSPHCLRVQGLKTHNPPTPSFFILGLPRLLRMRCNEEITSLPTRKI